MWVLSQYWHVHDIFINLYWTKTTLREKNSSFHYFALIQDKLQGFMEKHEHCDRMAKHLTICSSPQHHVKYQHLQQKSFICSHPTCSESFNIKKRPKEHVKLHSSEFLVHMNDICDKCHPVYFWVDRNYMYEYMHALICPDSISTLVYSGKKK